MWLLLDIWVIARITWPWPLIIAVISIAYKSCLPERYGRNRLTR
jgi:hypothetical protein